MSSCGLRCLSGFQSLLTLLHWQNSFRGQPTMHFVDLYRSEVFNKVGTGSWLHALVAVAVCKCVCYFVAFYGDVKKSSKVHNKCVCVRVPLTRLGRNILNWILNWIVGELAWWPRHARVKAVLRRLLRGCGRAQIDDVVASYHPAAPRRRRKLSRSICRNTTLISHAIAYSAHQRTASCKQQRNEEEEEEEEEKKKLL